MRLQPLQLGPGQGHMVITQRQDGGGFFLTRVDTKTGITIGQACVTFMPTPTDQWSHHVHILVHGCMVYSDEFQGFIAQDREFQWVLFRDIAINVMKRYYRLNNSDLLKITKL